MRRRARLLAGTAAIGVAAMLAGRSVYASFESTTSTPANRFSAGTVAIGDNDGGSAMLSLSSVSPGASDTSCIKVTYTGSLPASVRMYATVTGSLAPYLNLTVWRGTDSTPSFDSCAGFTPDAADYLGSGAGVVYNGTLAGYPASATTALTDAPGGPETWSTDEAHSYKFVVTLASNDAAQGLAATASFAWEATSQ